MKTPTVIEKHVIIIDGREHVISSTSWTESIGELIDQGNLENDDDEIIAHIKDSD